MAWPRQVNFWIFASSLADRLYRWLARWLLMACADRAPSAAATADRVHRIYPMHPWSGAPI